MQSPPLIKLTQIPHPNVADGKPTDVYVNPLFIVSVQRSRGAFNNELGKPYELVECTFVSLTTGQHLLVLETPQIVTAAREHALREMEDH